MRLGKGDIQEAFADLRHYVEANEFRGWDPYDALLSPFPFRWFGRWGEVIAIQAFKRCPVNFRPLFSIPKQENPKALGIFLESYANLYQSGDPVAEEICAQLFDALLKLRSKDFSGSCWGYNFPWSGPAKQLPVYYPSTVVTSTVVRGLHRYYEVSGKEEVRELIQDVPDYLLKDIHRYEDPSGLSFSYTPDRPDICYNASLFAAEALARCDAVGGTKEYLDIVTNAVEFVLARQKEDGAWMYSENEEGRERKQIDFHQGYILDSIHHIRKLYNIEHTKWEDALRKGAFFYKNRQFAQDGRSLRRLPRKWPADIHAQAQGVITFTLLRELDEEYLDFAESILGWTLNNMFSDRGFFYYQKHPLFTIKIPYMRWAQAWMMKAIVEFVMVRDES